MNVVFDCIRFTLLSYLMAIVVTANVLSIVDRAFLSRRSAVAYSWTHTFLPQREWLSLNCLESTIGSSSCLVKYDKSIVSSPNCVLTILILLYPIALATWWRLPNRLMYCVVHHIDSFTQVLPSSSLACVWSVLRRYHSTKASRQCCFFLFEPVWLVGMWQSKLQIRNLFLPRISRTSEMRSMKHHGLARKKSCLDAYHKKLGFGWREHENQTKMRH